MGDAPLENMIRSVTAFLVISCLVAVVLGNGFFCKKESDKFEICTRCSNVPDEDCEKPLRQGCHCSHIKLRNDENQLVGGPDCSTRDWCYIDQYTECDDMEEAFEAYSIRDLWYSSGQNIYKSYEACQSSHKPETGNEQ